MSLSLQSKKWTCSKAML